MRSFKELDLAHPGEPVFVLGTSDSLSGLDLQRLNEFVTVGTNDVLRIQEEFSMNFCPAYMLFVDHGALMRARPYLKMYPLTPILTRPRLADIIEVDMRYPGEVYIFDIKPRPHIGTEGEFKKGDNTAHYAVEAALRMRGTTPGVIGLLGVDLRYPTPEEESRGLKNHFFGDGTKEGCRPSFSKTPEYFRQAQMRLKAWGVDLVTCSPWKGPLTEFLLQRDLDSLIDDLKGGKGA